MKPKLMRHYIPGGSAGRGCRRLSAPSPSRRGRGNKSVPIRAGKPAVLGLALLGLSIASGLPARAAAQAGTQFSFADKQLSDDSIYDNVKRKLANDPDVKGGALDIDVKAGVVTLRGKVETEKQKQKAERLAKKVSGVKKVVNEIQLSLK